MASKNQKLNKAKEEKNDEFYTQISDIETELRHYKEYFKGKVVLCNCDDPRVSNFFKYFALNFETFGLKRLIATCYKNNDIDLFSQNKLIDKAVYMIYEGDKNGNKKVDLDEIQVKELNGDGDFRSQECIELLKQADIVCTNPPFSQFIDYINQLVLYKKEFIILGRLSATHYKNVFPLIKENKLWTGYGFNISVVFGSPYKNTNESNRKAVIKKGLNPDEGYIVVPAICWFTNLDVKKRHEKYIFIKDYNNDKESYPRYDNFDAIDVKSVADIPDNYYGYMGVPDTFLGMYNPEEFELIGLGSGDLAKAIGVTKNYRGRSDIAYTIDGVSKCPYSRIIIKRK